LNHLRGGIAGFGPDESKAGLAALDSNKDGKVTREELADYYRRSGLDAVRLQPGFERGASEALTDALFRHLDTNKDGKLSKEELAAAELVLLKLDLDEDEMLTPPEVAPEQFASRFRGPRGMGRQPDNNPFLLIAPGEAPARLSKQLLTRYDKDKNG